MPRHRSRAPRSLRRNMLSPMTCQRPLASHSSRGCNAGKWNSWPMQSISSRTIRAIFSIERLPRKRKEYRPAASWRMYPARTRNLWLATSASAGASRSVGMNSWDQRCMIASIHNSLPGMQECEGKRTWLHPLWSRNSSSLPRKGGVPDRRLMPLPAHSTSADEFDFHRGQKPSAATADSSKFRVCSG